MTKRRRRSWWPTALLLAIVCFQSWDVDAQGNGVGAAKAAPAGEDVRIALLDPNLLRALAVVRQENFRTEPAPRDILGFRGNPFGALHIAETTKAWLTMTPGRLFPLTSAVEAFQARADVTTFAKLDDLMVDVQACELAAIMVETFADEELLRETIDRGLNSAAGAFAVGAINADTEFFKTVLGDVDVQSAPLTAAQAAARIKDNKWLQEDWLARLDDESLLLVAERPKIFASRISTIAAGELARRYPHVNWDHEIGRGLRSQAVHLYTAMLQDGTDSVDLPDPVLDYFRTASCAALARQETPQPDIWLWDELREDDEQARAILSNLVSLELARDLGVTLRLVNELVKSVDGDAAYFRNLAQAVDVERFTDVAASIVQRIDDPGETLMWLDDLTNAELGVVITAPDFPTEARQQAKGILRDRNDG